MGCRPTSPLFIQTKRGRPISSEDPASLQESVAVADVGELSLEDRVVFTGYVPDDVLVSLYNGARIFVYPSYYEGFGLPPLEAMACGTPTIVSNTSTLPEIVGSSALQVDPNNVEQLKQAILKILTDRKLEKNLIKKGLQNAKKFTWHKSASEMLHTYNQLLSSE